MVDRPSTTSTRRPLEQGCVEGHALSPDVEMNSYHSTCRPARAWSLYAATWSVCQPARNGDPRVATSACPRSPQGSQSASRCPYRSISASTTRARPTQGSTCRCRRRPRPPRAPPRPRQNRSLTIIGALIRPCGSSTSSSSVATLRRAWEAPAAETGSVTASPFMRGLVVGETEFELNDEDNLPIQRICRLLVGDDPVTRRERFVKWSFTVEKRGGRHSHGGAIPEGPIRAGHGTSDPLFDAIAGQRKHTASARTQT